MLGRDDLKTLTVEETADILGVHAESVRRWVREGQLRAARWGRRLRIRLDAIREFQEAREVHPPDPADFIRRARRTGGAGPGRAARPGRQAKVSPKAIQGHEKAGAIPLPNGVLGDFIRRARRDGLSGGPRRAATEARISQGAGPAAKGKGSSITR